MKKYFIYWNYYSVKCIIKDLLDFIFYIILKPFALFNYYRWKRYQKEHKIKNILIICWGASGDIITASSAIAAIRKKYSDSKITFLGSKHINDIFPDFSAINHFIDYNKIKKINFIYFIKELRKTEYDLAVNLNWSSDRAALITILSKAKFTAGAGPRHWQIFYHLKSKPAYTITHQIERFINIVKAIGINEKDIKPVISLRKESRKKAENFWVKNKLGKKVIMIHPGAKEEYKRWNIKNYIKLAGKLIELFNVQIIIGWGPKEYELALLLKKNVKSNKIIIAYETKDINEFAALVSKCFLFIGNCSAPMNASVAVGTPCVIIMGPNNPVVWSPYGKEHSFLIPVTRCRNCKLPCTKEYICQESIKVDDVLTKVKEKLGY